MSNGIKLHPRTKRVDRASIQIGQAISDAWHEHDLTVFEVNAILVQQLDSILRVALRRERHPNDPDKGVDEE